MRASTSNVDGMTLVAESYLIGRGVPRDPAEARKWLDKAANAGTADAANDLANLYQAGDGVMRDAGLATQ
jgi:uncharacterized protein